MSAFHQFKALTLLAAITLLTVATASWPSFAAAQTLVGKSCGRCGAEVGIGAQVGQSCPHCGAQWGSQQNLYRSGGGSSSGAGGGFAPPPVNPWLQEYLRQRADRLARLEQRAEIFRKWHEEEIERWTSNREEAALAAAYFREHDDPERRAAQYLASARACEVEGNFRAAAAYYKLAARVSAGLTANAAQNALWRLAKLN